jgi:hypothetical protein
MGYERIWLPGEDCEHLHQPPPHWVYFAQLKRLMVFAGQGRIQSRNLKCETRTLPNLWAAVYQGIGITARGADRHHRHNRPLVRGVPGHAKDPLAPGIVRPDAHQPLALHDRIDPDLLLSRCKRDPAD